MVRTFQVVLVGASAAVLPAFGMHHHLHQKASDDDRDSTELAKWSRGMRNIAALADQGRQFGDKAKANPLLEHLQPLLVRSDTAALRLSTGPSEAWSNDQIKGMHAQGLVRDKIRAGEAAVMGASKENGLKTMYVAGYSGIPENPKMPKEFGVVGAVESKPDRFNMLNVFPYMPKGEYHGINWGTVETKVSRWHQPPAGKPLSLAQLSQEQKTESSAKVAAPNPDPPLMPGMYEESEEPLPDPLEKPKSETAEELVPELLAGLSLHTSRSPTDFRDVRPEELKAALIQAVVEELMDLDTKGYQESEEEQISPLADHVKEYDGKDYKGSELGPDSTAPAKQTMHTKSSYVAPQDRTMAALLQADAAPETEELDEGGKAILEDLFSYQGKLLLLDIPWDRAILFLTMRGWCSLPEHALSPEEESRRIHALDGDWEILSDEDFPDQVGTTRTIKDGEILPPKGVDYQNIKLHAYNEGKYAAIPVLGLKQLNTTVELYKTFQVGGDTINWDEGNHWRRVKSEASKGPLDKLVAAVKLVGQSQAQGTAPDYAQLLGKVVSSLLPRPDQAPKPAAGGKWLESLGSLVPSAKPHMAALLQAAAEVHAA